MTVPAAAASSDGVVVAMHHLTEVRAAAPLLVAHATGFHGLAYEPMAAALGGAYDVWSLDFRGHGATAAPAGWAVDWERYGDDAVSAATWVGAHAGAPAAPLVAFGHSMGGAALLMAAHRYPQLFAGLVLFEPIVMPPDADGDGPNPLVEGARRRRREFASYEAAYDNFASKPPMNAFDPAALLCYVHGGLTPVDPARPDGPVRLCCTPEHEAATFLAAPAHTVWKALGEIAVPVTVIGGSTDGGDRAALIAPYIAEQLLNGRFEPHPELDHFGPFTHPTATADIVVAAVGGR